MGGKNSHDGHLSVKAFHGPKQACAVDDLAQFDIVLTSYKLVLSDFKSKETILFRIDWKRIVLVEGQDIPNHKSETCHSICQLSAKYRWIITRAPIQNKAADMFSMIKFLQVQPFDDITISKDFLKMKENELTRLPLILETLLLRHTTDQLVKSGEIDPLPEITHEIIQIELNEQEKLFIPMS